MARPRKHRRDLPPRMYFKHGAYYHVPKGKWDPLGADLVEALREYYRREAKRLDQTVTFADLASAYLAHGTSSLAPRTLKDYRKYHERVVKTFGEVDLSTIEPHHVRRYHRTAAEKRGNVQANRERSYLSLVWNWGRAEGHTSLPNPCEGIHRAEESGRQVLVSDSVYRRVWVHADWDTRNIMDLARYIAQRPADAFKIKESDIVDGCLVVNQNKRRGKKIVRIEITGKLAKVIDRIRNQPGGWQLISPSAFDNRFEDARRRAGVDLHSFQFRDLRAKGLTRKADKEGVRAAQQLGGHERMQTTEIYINRRGGEKVRPAE